MDEWRSAGLGSCLRAAATGFILFFTTTIGGILDEGRTGIEETEKTAQKEKKENKSTVSAYCSGDGFHYSSLTMRSKSGI